MFPEGGGGGGGGEREKRINRKRGKMKKLSESRKRNGDNPSATEASSMDREDFFFIRG